MVRMTHSRELRLHLFRQMLRINMVERHMESLYHLDEMKTPIHLCIGQEAIAIGVCASLRQDDYIQSSHRSHGHYLAKGGDLKALIAELYCRETGCSSGRGGSMHVIDMAVGHLGSSSIVGGGIPIATGLALAAKMRGESRVSVAFFGDGAADQGVLYESINFAILKSLPVIFILEDNQWAVCSHVRKRQWGPNIFLSAPAGTLFTAPAIDGNDVLAVYDIATEAVERARQGQGPSLIECKTYRIRGHAGSYSDAPLGYRTEDEIQDWEERCPVMRCRQGLLANGDATESDLRKIEMELTSEIVEAFEWAQRGPLPRREDQTLHVFKE